MLIAHLAAIFGMPRHALEGQEEKQFGIALTKNTKNKNAKNKNHGQKHQYEHTHTKTQHKRTQNEHKTNLIDDKTEHKTKKAKQNRKHKHKKAKQNMRTAHFAMLVELAHRKHTRHHAKVLHSPRTPFSLPCLLTMSLEV